MSISRSEPSVFVANEFVFHERLADENLTALEIDISPLQTIDFAGPHAGKKSDSKIIAKVGAHTLENELHLFQRERFDIGLRFAKRLDVLPGRGEIELLGRFRKNHPQRRHDVIDPGRR